MKKTTTIILTILMIFSMTLSSSCGKDEELTRADCVFSTVSHDFGENVFYKDIASDGDAAYLLFNGYEYLEGKTNYSTVIYKLDRDGNFSMLVEIGDGYPERIAAAGGEIYVIGRDPDFTARRDYYVTKVKDGEIVTLCGSVNEAFGQDFTDNTPRGIAVDKDGLIYIAGENVIAVFDPGMKLIFEVDSDNNAYILTLGGEVYVETSDATLIKRKIAKIDPETKNLAEWEVLEDVPVNAKLYGSAEDGLFYDYNGEIHRAYGGEKILDFLNSDVDPSLYMNLSVIDAESVVCFATDYSSLPVEKELLFMKRIPDDEVPLKREIKVAYMTTGHDLNTLAVRFNRQSEKYRVKLVGYSEYRALYNDREASDKVLKNEFVSGGAPDIVATNGFSCINDLKKSGAFADILKLIDADGGFDRGDYFTSALDYGTDRDGRMTEFVARFALQTAVGKKENLPDSWNAEEFIEFIWTLEDGQYLFGKSMPETLVQFALKLGSGGVVDYENGKCDFDTPLFRKFLEFLKTQPSGFFDYSRTLSGDDLADYNADRYAVYRESRIMLNNETITNLLSVALDEVRFGGDVTYVGYATDRGNGSFILPMLTLAISEKSGAKEGAFEFLKFVAESERARDGFSSNIPVFRKCAESEMEYHYAIMPNGGYTKWKDGEDGGYPGTTRRDFTEDDLRFLESLINGASKPYPEFQKISSIISEEVGAYISGAKDIDETVRIIQDRASTYLAE